MPHNFNERLLDLGMLCWLLPRFSLVTVQRGHVVIPSLKLQVASWLSIVNLVHNINREELGGMAGD